VNGVLHLARAVDRTRTRGDAALPASGGPTAEAPVTADPTARLTPSRPADVGVEAERVDEGYMLLLGAAGCTFLIAVPGADDGMLRYQSLSFTDVLATRSVLGLRPAPEFEAWLARMGLLDETGRVRELAADAPAARALLAAASA
jgi:hypothetical protein